MILYLLLSLFIQTGTTYKFVDMESKKPISDLYVSYNGKTLITNSLGEIELNIRPTRKKIKIKHAKYGEKIIALSKARNNTFFLTQVIFEAEEQHIEEDRSLVVNPETEFKTEKLAINQIQINSMIDIKDEIATNNKFTLQKALSGKNTLSFLNSQDYEVNFTLADFSLSESILKTSHSNILINSLIQNININTYNSRSYLATVNNEVNLKNSNISISSAENILNTKASYYLKSKSIHNVTAVEHYMRKYDYTVNNDHFEFPFSFVKKSHSINNYTLIPSDDVTVSHFIAFNYFKDTYLEYAERANQTIIDGLSFEYKSLKLTNRFLYTEQAYHNATNINAIVTADKENYENNVELTYSFKGKRNFFKASAYRNDYYNALEEKKIFKDVESHVSGLNLVAKISPEKTEQEKKSVIELNTNIEDYNSDLLVSYGIKTVIVFGNEKTDFDIFIDYLKNSTHDIENQRLYFSQHIDSTLAMSNKNFTIGFNASIPKLKLNYYYSSRTYQNFIYKSHSILNEFLSVLPNASFTVNNVSFTYTHSKLFNAQATVQHTKRDPFEALVNRPELLVKLAANFDYKNHSLRLRYSIENDKHLIYNLKGNVYSKLIPKTNLLNIRYSYSFESLKNLGVSAELQNALDEVQTSVNGFEYKERNVLLGLNYNF